MCALLCSSPGFRETFPTISAIARNWSEIRGRHSLASFLPLMPRYWRGKCHQQSGSSLKEKSLEYYLEEKKWGRQRETSIHLKTLYRRKVRSRYEQKGFRKVKIKIFPQAHFHVFQNKQTNKQTTFFFFYLNKTEN